MKYKKGDKVYLKNKFDAGIPTPSHYNVISCNKTHVHIINNANAYFTKWVKLDEVLNSWEYFKMRWRIK